MTKHEIFAQFFTNLLKLENRLEAQKIAEEVWQATSDMWLHVMEIDPVLVELGVAKVMDDGRMGYRVPDRVPGGPGWEIELPTPEQEAALRDQAEAMASRLVDPVVFLANGGHVPWSYIKERARAREGRVTFRIADDANEIEFHLGPDIFPDSYRLAWTTPEERTGGPFMDRRVRSSEPDDFLSRIKALIRTSHD